MFAQEYELTQSRLNQIRDDIISYNADEDKEDESVPTLDEIEKALRMPIFECNVLAPSSHGEQRGWFFVVDLEDTAIAILKVLY